MTGEAEFVERRDDPAKIERPQGRTNEEPDTPVTFEVESPRTTIFSPQEVQHEVNGSMFSNAHNLNILGGNFTVSSFSDSTHFSMEENAQGIAYRREKLEKAMELLRSNTAIGASYDCAARSDVPKCHPNTREAIIGKIKSWIKSLGNNRIILWMYGPAGCGKTTIAGTIAEMSDEEGMLAASFFFSRSAPRRPRDKTYFITTVACQLCLSVPGVRDYVAGAVDRDPHIFSKALSRQMKELIVTPLNRLAADSKSKRLPISSPSKVIIIDGLDECDTSKSQTEILNLLAEAATQLTYPLLFFIASRPEHDIRTAFSAKIMSSLMHSLPLDNDYQADADIRRFLTARFEEIKRSHPASPDIPKTWPSKGDLNYLVEKSSGQYIYASVVMNFVASNEHLPMRQLELVRESASTGSAIIMPFAQLDALYSRVLSSLTPSNLAGALAILSWMILDTTVTEKNLDIADILFSRRPGESRVILSGLTALIHIPTSGATKHFGTPKRDLEGISLQPIPVQKRRPTSVKGGSQSSLRFFHASFPDFLLDKSRSGSFSIEISLAHTNLTRRWIKYHKNHHLPGSTRDFETTLSDAKDASGMSTAEITSTIFRHCGKAAMTVELQDDLYALNLQKALIVVGPLPRKMWWPQLYRVLNFVVWLKHQVFPNAEKDLYYRHLHSVQAVIRGHLSTYPAEIVKYASISLRLPWGIQIPGDSISISPIETLTFLFMSMRDRDILDLRNFGDLGKTEKMVEESDPSLTARDMLCDQSLDLLVEILAGSETSTVGNYTIEQRKRTDLAIAVAQRLLPLRPPYQLSIDKIYKLARLMCILLPKASPDLQLASLLRDEILQLDTKSLPHQYPYSSKQILELLRDLSLAGLLYIKESGIPPEAREHHAHFSGFDRGIDICALCLSQEWEY